MPSAQHQTGASRSMRTFERDSAKIFQLARGGSITALYAIVTNISACPQHRKPDVTRMLCSYLDASKIPVPRHPIAVGSAAFSVLDCASTSFMGLGQILRDKSLLPIAVGSWPGLFEWILYFQERNFHVPMHDRDDIMEMIMYVIYLMQSDDNMARRLRRTPRVINLATVIWMAEDPASDSVITSAFERLLLNASAATMEEVVAAAGTFDAVADRAILRLRTALRRRVSLTAPTRLVAHFGAAVELMRHFGSCPNDDLGLALMDRGAIIGVTKLLVKLTSLRIYNDAAIRHTISICFHYLASLVDASDGVTGLQQAVKNGLLRAIVDVSPMFDQLHEDTQESLRILLGEVVPRYVLFRSIVSRAAKALEPLRATDYKEKITNSPLKNLWEALCSLVSERAEAKAQLDTLTKVARCQNCHKTAQKVSLRRCSGCHSLLYCSEECQIEAWERGHRKLCSIIAARPPKVHLPADGDSLREKDRVFHEFITRIDIRVHAARLRAMAVAQFPGVAPTTLGVGVDYTASVDPRFSLFRLGDRDRLRHLRETEDAEFNKDILRAAVAGQGTLVETIMPLGATQGELIFLYSPPTWMDESESV
ncbi:hypothetical protein FA95DRAFT_1679681 [Auriscalpium vulgare]|uniref:Uncharacterized protein n=1 Tax=Auriscalpium vulgare TaxID=40419 RepID=A0ACB8RSL6_9AGAM|nr:hypothetical protein FA95DRAFT_1679681 [Auriscalpium vulgare]